MYVLRDFSSLLEHEFATSTTAQGEEASSEPDPSLRSLGSNASGLLQKHWCPGASQALLIPTQGLNSPKSPLLPAFPSVLGAPGQRGILDQTHRVQSSFPGTEVCALGQHHP